MNNKVENGNIDRSCRFSTRYKRTTYKGKRSAKRSNHAWHRHTQEEREAKRVIAQNNRIDKALLKEEQKQKAMNEEKKDNSWFNKVLGLLDTQESLTVMEESDTLKQGTLEVQGETILNEPNVEHGQTMHDNSALSIQDKEDKISPDSREGGGHRPLPASGE